MTMELKHLDQPRTAPATQRADPAGGDRCPGCDERIGLWIVVKLCRKCLDEAYHSMKTMRV